MRRPLLALAFLVCGSCNLLQLGSWGQRSPLFSAPSVRVGDPALTSSPALEALARYYCADLIGTGGALACNALLGPAPSRNELSFVFSIPLDVGNPNAFPLPAIEALVALTLFPDTSDHTLGATCTSTDPDLRTVDDFAVAALEVLTGVVSGDAPALHVPTIEADGSRRLTLALSIDAGTLLDLLANEVSARWQAYLADESVSVSIPFELDGTVWFVVEGLGRVGFPFGPVAGEWTVK
jgi:hypothetical protein